MQAKTGATRDRVSRDINKLRTVALSQSDENIRYTFRVIVSITGNNQMSEYGSISPRNAYNQQVCESEGGTKASSLKNK